MSVDVGNESSVGSGITFLSFAMFQSHLSLPTHIMDDLLPNHMVNPPQPSDTSPNPSSNMGDGWLRVRVGMVLELSPNLCLDEWRSLDHGWEPESLKSIGGKVLEVLPSGRSVPHNQG